MLERSQRPMGEEDRRVLESYRQRAIGKVQFEARYTFLAGVVGFIVAIVGLLTFHWKAGVALYLRVGGLTAAGAAVGFSVDVLRARKRLKERQAAAAAKWDPVVAVGMVEHVVAETSKALRIDDHGANTAWFLQVSESQILCVWDWADEATERVEVDLVPGGSPTPLKISWTGKKLRPLRPKRKFKRGEREPEQFEVLNGILEEIDGLLRQPSSVTRKPAARATPSSKLVDELEPLGFYKYISADQVNGSKAEIEDGAYAWFLGAGRAFDADAERLAEGGVKDLLDYLRPALVTEGCVLGELDESYDEHRGYTVRIGGEQHTLWSETEAQKSWELTTARAAGLINGLLTKAGSQERLHVLGGGEDAVFVLLTPGMRELIARSGAFRAEELPAPA